MSKICPNCSNSIPDNDKFCPNCGYRVVDNQTSPENKADEAPDHNKVFPNANQASYGNPPVTPITKENPVFAFISSFSSKNCNKSTLNIATFGYLAVWLVSFLILLTVMVPDLAYDTILGDVVKVILDIIPSWCLSFLPFLFLAFMFMHLHKVLIQNKVSGTMSNALIVAIVAYSIIFLFINAFEIDLSKQDESFLNILEAIVYIFMFIVGYKIIKLSNFSWLSKIIMADASVSALALLSESLNESVIFGIIVLIVEIALPLVMRSALSPYYSK